VDGAQPGDALAVKILDLQVDGDQGVGAFYAYELLSKVAKIHLDEMVDPNYVVIASIDKKFLPARKK
jgi:acetamidase/formamidase